MPREAAPEPATVAPAAPVVPVSAPSRGGLTERLVGSHRVPAPQPLPPIPPVLLAGDHPTPELWPAAVIGTVSQPAADHGHQERVMGADFPILDEAEAGRVFAAPIDPSGPAPIRFPALAALWLQPRDPFCVVAFWQVNEVELAAYAGSRPGGNWRLRVHAGTREQRLVNEQPLPSGTDYRFVPVLTPGEAYVAELGFLAADGTWNGLAVSPPVTTPVDAPALEWTGTIARFSPPVRPKSRRASALSAESRPPAMEARRPFPGADEAAALTALVWETTPVPGMGSSADLTQSIVRRVTQSRAAGASRPRAEVPSSPVVAGSSAALPGLPSSGGPAPGLSSRGFWFKVNAELILYGRTEPDASVTLGGRSVKLRSDGSFSFRFALPDGEFDLPARAVNNAGDDTRLARLRFSRATEKVGDVGVHPQDSSLHPPVADAVA